MLYNSIVAPHLKTVVEDVLKCHNTSFEKKKKRSKFLKFHYNKVVLNSYLVRIVICWTESIKAIYRVMWIIDFL